MRYRSNIDAGRLTQAAQNQLAQSDPPVFLAYLLALGAGFAPDRDRPPGVGRVSLESFGDQNRTDQYFDVKTEHSIGDVSIDPETHEMCSGVTLHAPLPTLSSRLPLANR